MVTIEEQNKEDFYIDLFVWLKYCGDGDYGDGNNWQLKYFYIKFKKLWWWKKYWFLHTLKYCGDGNNWLLKYFYTM